MLHAFYTNRVKLTDTKTGNDTQIETEGVLYINNYLISSLYFLFLSPPSSLLSLSLSCFLLQALAVCCVLL
jgi:hypothetical protein